MANRTGAFLSSADGDGGNLMHARLYSNELKAEAVRLVIETRLTAAQTATRLGVRAEAVSVWVRRYRESRAKTDDVRHLNLILQNMIKEREALEIIASRLMQLVG